MNYFDERLKGLLVYFGSISIWLFLSVARERGKVESIERKFFIIRTFFLLFVYFFMDIDIWV